jgi:flagellar biosynthesis/type III secretory pathway chaperone
MFQPADLSKALDEELGCVGSFQELLDQEREALTASDLERVAELAENKLVVGQRLQQCTGHRETVRRALSGDNGSRDPLNADPLNTGPLNTDGPLADKWRQLTTALEQAREANRINGLLVSSRLAAVGNALNTLHSAVGGAAPLYHADGSTQPVQGQSGGAHWSA